MTHVVKLFTKQAVEAQQVLRRTRRNHIEIYRRVGKRISVYFGGRRQQIPKHRYVYTKPHCVSHLIVYAYNNIAINLFVRGVSGYVHKIFIFLSCNNPNLA